MVQESTNTFSDGLISDLNPLTTPNTVLTDALNATLLTFNGNELVLQNDMGNAKITGCELTKGFIPLGIKEHGGVLYIVSHNPKTKETEIGSFPSPKPTVLENQILEVNINIDSNGNNLNKNIQLSKSKLNPGDKFIIFFNSLDFSTLSTLNTRKFYKLKLISIVNGIETDITDTLIPQKEYISDNNFIETDNWFIKGSKPNELILENYILNGMTQIYKIRKSGQLYVRVELENIDELSLKNTTSFYQFIKDVSDESKLVKISTNTFENINLIPDGIKSLSQIIDDYNIVNTDYNLKLNSENFIPKLNESIIFTKGNNLSIYPLLQIFNTQNEIDGNFYLNFNIYIKALSEIKPDTLDISLKIIDLSGEKEDETIYNSITLSDFTSGEYNINNLILNIGNSNNVAVIYKITCRNINYDITFDDFLINDIIDLSIDPSQWGNSEGSDYDFYDYDLFDYDTI